MFTSIVVATDLAADGDRALPVARALVDIGGPSVDLLTVTSPHVTGEVDAFELSRSAGYRTHSSR